MRINHNISAMNTYRQYNVNTSNSSKSMEKLSSGYRINRAADDAAGLSISEKMRSQIRGLTQATRNAQDGVSFIQTAEGALNEVSDMLTRLKELSVQVQNGTYSNDDKANIGSEMEALGKAIGDIYVNTKFNGIAVFGNQEMAAPVAGKTSTQVETMFATAVSGDKYIKFDSGSGAWQSTGTSYTGTTPPSDFAAVTDLAGVGTQGLTSNTIYILDTGKFYAVDADGAKTGTAVTFDAIAATNGDSLNANAGGTAAATIAYGEDARQSVTIDTAVTTNLAALTARTSAAGTTPTGVTVQLVENAITEVNTTRANYGAQQNQLEHAANNLSTTKENLQSAESRVRDVDMAEEMMEYTKNNILMQAAQSMLAQANSQPQGVLQLLQ
ncbi:MAG: flagellar hook-associated protein FlgL [Clostridiaceae bacterium]|nr:flagellar hook-associated protein FlgL [Clostridiaceae bacterium]